MLVFLIISALFSLRVYSQTSNSVASDSGYLQQRGCVKSCLWGDIANGDLSINLGCTAPWVNECYCRADQAPVASSFLSKCVSSVCLGSASVDVSLALSVYDQYCATAMGTPAQARATTTIDPNSPIVTVMVISTVTSSAGTMIPTTASSKWPHILFAWAMVGCTIFAVRHPALLFSPPKISF